MHCRELLRAVQGARLDPSDMEYMDAAESTVTLALIDHGINNDAFPLMARKVDVVRERIAA